MKGFSVLRLSVGTRYLSDPSTAELVPFECILKLKTMFDLRLRR
jgi:hypothetical protein